MTRRFHTRRRPLGSCNRDRPGRHELLDEHVDPKIHSFERARAEQQMSPASAKTRMSGAELPPA